MENAHKRKKQPVAVRRSLLDEATRLAVTHGLRAVTVQAVADAAGVTKGGFMHHFPNKQALITAIFDELLDYVGHDLVQRMAADPEPYGSFTRAYINSVLSLDWQEKANPVASLSVLMLTDADLRLVWTHWFNTLLQQHQATDGAPELAIARLAVDGVWLADIAKTELPDRAFLQEHLLALTRPAS